MINPTMLKLIPILWFDQKGCGPSELAFEFHLAPPIPEPQAHEPQAGLVLQVVESDEEAATVWNNAKELVNSGFLLYRNDVVELKSQLDAWLAANPAPLEAPPETPVTPQTPEAPEAPISSREAETVPGRRMRTPAEVSAALRNLNTKIELGSQTARLSPAFAPYITRIKDMLGRLFGVGRMLITDESCIHHYFDSQRDTANDHQLWELISDDLEIQVSPDDDVIVDVADRLRQKGQSKA